MLANSELALRSAVGRAIAALELADGGLLELGDPGLGNVRRAIASELQALRAVPQPDLEGAAAELGSLMERVAELPLRARKSATPSLMNAVPPRPGKTRKSSS